MAIPRITLEQWAAFKAVVDEGSFARAAESLNKSQSSISYAIARLEEQLPTPVLEQKGRKAVLTEEGKVLYRHASQLLIQATEVEQSAKWLAKGWESEITLAVDVIIPLDPIFQALESFSEQSGSTRVRLLETSLSGTTEALLERRADLVLTPTVPPGFFGTPLMRITMIPMANPKHPLFELNRELSSTDLKQHRQIVVQDSGIKRQQDAGWLGAEQRWTVANFSTSIKAVKSNLGFAFIPEELAEQELQSGSLKPLPLIMKAERLLSIYLVIASQENAGPGTKALAEKIQSVSFS